MYAGKMHASETLSCINNLKIQVLVMACQEVFL